MASRKLRLVLFAIAFFSLLSRCAAGPIRGNLCVRDFSPSKDLFPQFLPVSSAPKTVFHLDGVDLTHLVIPLEFRRPDSRSANANDATPQIQLWNPLPTQFCPSGYHLTPTL